MKTVPTDRRLRRFSEEHLWYEISMLWEAERRLRHPIDDAFICNVLIECFGVHLRLIVDFLYKPAKYDDDVSSDHFVVDLSAWHKARGNLPGALRAAVRRADKQLAHLTFKRYRG